MKGTATLFGKPVIIVDIAGGMAMITTGQAAYLTWIAMEILENVDLFKDIPSCQKTG